MVSEKKREVVKEVQELAKTHKVIGILDMHKVPAKQLFEIRKKLKGHAKIRVVKKRVIKIDATGNPDLIFKRVLEVIEC